ncbi:MAG: glycosyltransferase family 2 protein [Candidatus Eiseniibacteriota bacterium]
MSDPRDLRPNASAPGITPPAAAGDHASAAAARGHATPAPSPGHAPLVSVVMPARNAVRFIDQALQSLLDQTHTRWELVVVDDASSDGTAERVNQAARADRRIRLIQLARRVGPGPARNVALAEIRGDYIAFLDSDDIWLPGKLERQLRFMREHGAAFSIHGYRMIDEHGRERGRPIAVPARVDYQLLLRHTIIAPVTVLLDRERVGPLEMPDLPQHEDLVLWFRILKRGIVAHGMPEELARYRIVKTSASRDKLRSARRMWRVYRRIEGLSFSRAAWCYSHYAWNAWRKYR